jgi:hypothetical protein
MLLPKKKIVLEIPYKREPLNVYNVFPNHVEPYLSFTPCEHIKEFFKYITLNIQMEFIQSLFIHRFICFVAKLSCIENTFNTWINVVTNELWTYEWTNFSPFYIFVLNMFSTHDICMKCMDLWMNEFFTISITKSKFVVYISQSLPSFFIQLCINYGLVGYVLPLI